MRNNNAKKNKKNLDYKRFGAAMLVLALAVGLGWYLSDLPDSAGDRVAAAAGRVNEQVGDTRDDFREIQNLALEAQAPPAVMQETTSGGGTRASTSAAVRPAPASHSAPGVPAGVQGGVNIAAVPGGDHDEGNEGDASAAPPATLTFNEKAREIQGAAPLTVHQDAAQRLVDSWQPQYEAAVQEHNSLMLRISETRALWNEYRDEQTGLINEMHNSHLGANMAMDLRSDIRAFEEWDRNAEHIEIQSNIAMQKLHDMNRAIQFQRNRADFRAVIGQSSIGMSLQVSLLLESLDTFENRTNALSAAITSG